MAKPTRTPMTTAGLPALGSTTGALIQMATKPDRQSREYGAWIEQEDFLAFLRDERQRDEVVLYAGLTHCFLYGIAVPSSAVSPIDVDDLLGWSCNPFSSWGLCHGYREGASERQMWIGCGLARTLDIAHLPGESRLFSLFGLRVGAAPGLAKSTTYARRFIVNRGDRSSAERYRRHTRSRTMGTFTLPCGL